MTDVDNGGILEILLVTRENLISEPGTIIVLDGRDRIVEWFYRLSDTYPITVNVADINSDNIMDVVVGTHSGIIYLINEAQMGS